MQDLINLLKASDASCVVRKNGECRKFFKPGVFDLLNLYRQEPLFLRGADVADKIIGSAAASILVMAKVSRVHSMVMSVGAIEIFEKYRIEHNYTQKCDFILGKNGKDLCMMEKLCLGKSVEESLVALENKLFGAQV